MKILLGTGVIDVNAVDEDGDMALTCAAAKGHFGTTKIFAGERRRGPKYEEFDRQDGKIYSGGWDSS